MLLLMIINSITLAVPSVKRLRAMYDNKAKKIDLAINQSKVYFKNLKARWIYSFHSSVLYIIHVIIHVAILHLGHLQKPSKDESVPPARFCLCLLHLLQQGKKV